MVTRQVAMATATLSFGVLLVLLAFLSGTSYGYLEVTSFCSDISSMVPPLLISERRNNTSVAKHRKLLRHDTLVEPNRIWGEKCSKSDIVINQGPTAPLPNGIPTYTVEIMNVCVTGCDISGIHLNCGWFSSARLISPKIFKRLHYNDCLVNNGKPLANGGTLSFQYANTYLYPLSVFSLIC